MDFLSNLLKRVIQLCPKGKPEFIQSLDTSALWFPVFAIWSLRRAEHFFAQVLHESGFLSRGEENLRYSARRLMAVWPRRFPTMTSALPYAWDSSDPDMEDAALADLVYGHRMGNELNGTDDDDGWKYRGQGLIQLTGFANFQRIGKVLNIPLVEHPELALSSQYAVACAAAFWGLGRCNVPADNNNIVGVTQIINGGQNGIEERKKILKQLRG